MTVALTWQCIGDPCDLARLEAQWWELWAQTRSATPFQSPAWLIPWWQAFCPGTLSVVIAHAGDRLIALAPFYVEQSALERRMLPLGVSLSDYQDVLIASEWHEGFDALAARMTDSDLRWDSWELTELAPDAQALRLPTPVHCEDILEQSSACPVLRFPSRNDAVCHPLTCRQRRSLRGARNRASRRGAVEIVAANEADALSLLENLIRLHSARWAGRGEAGVLADARVQRFQREAVPRLMRAGFLRLYELRIASRAVGLYYGFLHRGRAYAYLTGFDPDYAFESPGVILLGHAIDEAIREGAHEFHFLRGQEVYKYRWGAADRCNLRRVIRKTSVYARAS